MWIFLAILGTIVCAWYLRETVLNPRYGEPLDTAPILYKKSAHIVIRSIIILGAFSICKIFFSFESIKFSTLISFKIFFSFKMLIIIFFYSIGDTILNLLSPVIMSSVYTNTYSKLQKLSERETPPSFNKLSLQIASSAILPTYLSGLLNTIAISFIINIYIGLTTITLLKILINGFILVLLLGLVNFIVQFAISFPLLKLGQQLYTDITNLAKLSGVIQFTEGVIIFHILLFYFQTSGYLLTLNVEKVNYLLGFTSCLSLGLIASTIISFVLSIFGGLFGSVMRAFATLLPIFLYINFYFYSIYQSIH